MGNNHPMLVMFHASRFTSMARVFVRAASVARGVIQLSENDSNFHRVLAHSANATVDLKICS
jgi:hypothetical protein